MSEPPDRALQRFRDELGPELRHNAGFVLQNETAGRLRYSDGIVDPRELEHFAGVDPGAHIRAGFRRRRDAGLYRWLRRSSARRIQVEFAAEGLGTRVTVRGRAPRNVRDAIGRLGQPGRWPQIAR